MKRIMISEGPEQTCSACPTIFDFKGEDGKAYYFRLRNGYARVGEDTDNGVTLISGDFPNGDGVCLWHEAVAWAKSQGLLLIVPVIEKDRMIEEIFNLSGDWLWCSPLRWLPFEEVEVTYNNYKEENNA